MATDFETDRAGKVWQVFADSFGKDALGRKFGPVPPESWAHALGKLNDFELQRGLRRMLQGGRSHVPTLPEFLRLCREVASDQFPDEQRPVPMSHRIEGPQLARWDAQANQHLMAFLMRAVLEKRTYPPEQFSILREHSRHWAQEMRDAEADEGVPADNGRRWWNDRMKLAAEQIQQLGRSAA